MSLYTPSTTGSFRYGRFNGPLNFLEIIVEKVLLVSCQNLVTLNAIILGDETDHTFYWEQTGGPAVIWLEPQNQKMVMYEKNISDDGDCFFRFWVDRYTPFKQFRDLVVSGSAREDVRINTYVSNNGDLLPPIGTINFTVYPGLTYAPEVTLNNSNKFMLFTVPQINYPAEETVNVIYEVSDGIYTPVSQVPGYSNLFLNVDITKKYAIRYFYKIFGMQELYYQSPTRAVAYIQNSTTLDTGEVFAQKLFESSLGTISVFQVSIVELLSELVEESIAENFYNSGTNMLGSNNVFQTQIIDQIVVLDNSENVSAINTFESQLGRITVFQIQVSDGITVIG